MTLGIGAGCIIIRVVTRVVNEMFITPVGDLKVISLVPL